MAETLDWKWHQFDAKQPPSGVRLVLKMADKHDNISYAIGILDHRTGDMSYTAKEDKSETLPVFWMQLPQ
jgi:hypothetical protein